MFAGNLRTLPLSDVFQALNNIKATGVLRLTSQAGSRDVVVEQGEIIGVGFLDREAREELEVRLTLLGIGGQAGESLQAVTLYWSAMEARNRDQGVDNNELIHQQAHEQLHNLFAWHQAAFSFEEVGPDHDLANAMVTRCLERPLAIDTQTLLLEAARLQDEWADVRSRIRNEAGVVARESAPQVAVQAGEATKPPPPSAVEDPVYHLHLRGAWQDPVPRSFIVAQVKSGSLGGEVWTYDPRTHERQTIDQLIGGTELRRVSTQELDALRQAARAAEIRMLEERSARTKELAELRGLAAEILRLAREHDPADTVTADMAGRLSSAIDNEDPTQIALGAETVVASLIHHLRALAPAGQALTQTTEQQALERALAETRQQLERAERGRRDQERLNSHMQERMYDLSKRLADGEQRLVELGQLAEQLAQARAHAAQLAAESERIKEDLALIRKQATGRLDNTRRRLTAIRERLREARRESRAIRTAPSTGYSQVPWSSPATAMYAAAPATAPMPVVPMSVPTSEVIQVHSVPTPEVKPGTAMFSAMSAPAQPRVSVPTSASFHAASELAPANSGTALIPNHPGVGRRGRDLPRRWLIGMSVTGVVVAVAWWLTATAIPITDRAMVNARLAQVTSPIPGLLVGDGIQAAGTQVRRGDVLARVRNDLDDADKQKLKARMLTVESQSISTDAALGRVKSEHDRLSRELGEQPNAPDVTTRTRLRDELAMRLVEMSAHLDDLRVRHSELSTDMLAEERRLAMLREASLSSPVDGVVWRRSDGRTVLAGTEICTVADSSSIIIEAEVDRSWLGLVRPGDQARVRVGTTEVAATVHAVAPGLAETANLAWQQAPSPSGIRILLAVSSQDRVALTIGHAARVAITGSEVGWLGRFALAVRF